MAVVFGLVVLVGVIPVVEFGGGAFLPQPGVGHFGICRPTALPPRSIRLQTLVMKLFKVTVVSGTDRAVSEGPEREERPRETLSQNQMVCCCFPPSQPRSRAKKWRGAREELAEHD